MNFIGKFTESMKDYAESKFSKIIPYLSKEAYNTLEVKYSIEGVKTKVEASLNYENIHLRVAESGEDYYSLVDILEDQLIRKIRKFKTAIIHKEKASMNKFFSDMADFHREQEEAADYDNISKQKTLILVEESAEEAINSMEELGHKFYVYRDIDTHDITIIYKRNRGDYGQIICK